MPFNYCETTDGLVAVDRFGDDGNRQSYTIPPYKPYVQGCVSTKGVIVTSLFIAKWYHHRIPLYANTSFHSLLDAAKPEL